MHVGEEVGQGEMVKLINNAVAAANAHTLAQALVVGRATGIDLDALAQVMGAGSGGSAMLALKAGPMREHDYSTLFKLEHMLKDVRLCLEEGQAAGVPFPAAAAVREALVGRHGPRPRRRGLRRARGDGRGPRRRAPLGALIRPSTEVSMPFAALARKGVQSRHSGRTRARSPYQGGRMSSPGDTAGAPRPRLTLIGGSGGAAQRERSAPARDAGEPVVRARLAAITDRCWQCRTKVRGIVGVLVDPARTPDSTGFLPFDDVAEMLADRLDPRALAGRRIGRVAHRESPASPAATWPTAASSATRSSAASSSRTSSTSTCSPAAPTPSSTSAFRSSSRPWRWRAASGRTPSADAPAKLHRNPSISRAIWVFGSSFARMVGIPSTRTGFRPPLGMSHV